MTAVPIACTLSGGDYKERLAWIADLNRSWLKATQRDGLRLSLIYDAEARASVEVMIARERACCPFLSFEIAERDGAIALDILAPEEACEFIDGIFEPFVQAGAAQKADCRCCGAAA